MIKFYTEIELFGIVVRDPVTALTNLLIFLTAVWCFRRLRPIAAEQGINSWRWFFLFMGTASFIAIFVHGFSFYMAARMHFGLWVIMCLSQGLGATFAQLAVIRQTFSHSHRGSWSLLSVAQYFLFGVLLLVFSSYEVVKIHIAACLLPIMIWYAIQYFSGNPAGGMIALGILVASFTALVHTFKMSFGLWFNHNDISHLLICIGLALMSSGALRSGEIGETAKA